MMTIEEQGKRAKSDLDAVYSYAYEKGKSESGTIGYDEGYADGQKAEYDSFWDSYQQNGQRRNYNYAFFGWTTDAFKPKYPIIATGDASYMFGGCLIGNQDAADFDFVERGIVLDTSGATSLTYMFRNALGIKRIGALDCTSCKDLNRLFYSCRVETIDEFKVNENTTYTNTFDYTSRLNNITISGTIGKSINFSACPLSYESMKSIIHHLKYLNGTGEEGYHAQTITFSEACWALLAEHDEECEGWEYAGWGWRDLITNDYHWATS